MRETGKRPVTKVAMAALAVVLALILCACTGEPEDGPTAPSFLPAPSESTTPAETTGPRASPSDAEPTDQAQAPPELPEAATQETPEGAAAFATWWFATLNYATATGDTERFTQAFQPECETCSGFRTRISDAYSTGGRIQGGALSVEVEPSPVVQDGVATMVVRANSEAGAVLDTSGEIATVLDAESVNLVMAVAWTGDSWIVGDVVS